MKLRRGAETNRGPRIEIIPLIDIMFFLLATFVFVSTSMIHNKGVQVSLPQSTSGVTTTRNESYSITVLASGEYFLGKQKMGLPELANELARIKAEQADARIFVNGDKDATVQMLIAALDEIRRAGLSNVSLETKAVS